MRKQKNRGLDKKGIENTEEAKKNGKFQSK